MCVIVYPMYTDYALCLVPRPRPLSTEKGLVAIERFLGCADSTVLLLRHRIKLQ